MKIAALLFSLIFVQYALTAINTRMVAQGRYLGTAVSDALLACFSFTLIRAVADTDALSAQAAYVAGGVCGGVVGVWLSRSQKKST